MVSITKSMNLTGSNNKGQIANSTLSCRRPIYGLKIYRDVIGEKEVGSRLAEDND